MDTTALIPPEQGKRTRSINNRHLLPEIIEEILSNLPLKSVVRFSSVSKSWNSMIFEPRFARKHKSRAAFLRRDRLVIHVNSALYQTDFFCALSSISFAGDRCYSSVSWPNVVETCFVSQFEGKPYLRAFCDELWCVEVKEFLFLWNPSMRNYRKLPLPLFKSKFHYWVGGFLYGLGYDSVSDDYKILKIGRPPSTETELYSLKNNCWGKIESSSAQPSLSQKRCEFVDGRFHWIGVTTAGIPIIVSFNLSTEKYGEVTLPQYSPVLNYNFLEEKGEDDLEVVVVRGMLCACLNYTKKARFVLWVMEEYGVEKSWTKKFDIHHYTKLRYSPAKLKPLYFSDNNDILIKVYDTTAYYMDVVMYKNEEARPTKIVSCCEGLFYKNCDAFLYVESLISPAGYNDQ